MKDIEGLNLEIDHLKHKLKYNEEVYKIRLEAVKLNLKKQFCKKKDNKTTIISLLEEETKILRTCIKKLQSETISLKSEITELTSILKVPRKHYKFIENCSTLSSIIAQKNSILSPEPSHSTCPSNHQVPSRNLFKSLLPPCSSANSSLDTSRFEEAAKYYRRYRRVGESLDGRRNVGKGRSSMKNPFHEVNFM
jgi:hypothetical protein